MKESIRVTVSLLVSLAAFALLFFGLKWQIWVSAALALLLYGAVYLMGKPILRIGSVKVDSIKGGEELHQMMADAQDDMRTIYNASQSVRDQGVKDKALKLHQLGNSILSYLSENPGKIGSARRFFTYYLDTGAGILDKYMRLARTNPNSSQVQQLTPQTAQAMDILHDAFMGQFNKLMQNELIDVEADIRLLENTLKMEG